MNSLNRHRQNGRQKAVASAVAIAAVAFLALEACRTNQNTCREHVTLTGHADRVNSVAFCPDGKGLASANSEEGVRIWEVGSGKEIRALGGNTNVSLRSIAFSPDGKRLALGGSNGSVKVLEVETGKEVLTLKGQPSGVSSVVFSPDGKRLASGGLDHADFYDVRVWDADTGKENLLLKQDPGSGVNAVAFSPDGKFLASASSAGTVKVWETETGRELLTLKRYTEFLCSVAFSPDGKRLASGGAGWGAITLSRFGMCRRAGNC